MSFTEGLFTGVSKCVDMNKFIYLRLSDNNLSTGYWLTEYCP